MNKKIFLSSPTMNGSEMKYIEEAFAENWIAPLGKNVDEFEKEIAKFVGSKHGAALSAGTAAIHLALKCVGVEAGDIVICSDLTFAATCNPILYQKAIPVFIDCEKDSWNMDPDLLKKALECYPNAKAVITVNLYGAPGKLDRISSICREYGVPLIEDAAESLGAEYKGKQTGTYGEYGVFSFNGNKIITSSGGGMLVSDNEEAVKKVRFWATQAREPKPYYEHKEIGYNYRMSNICAGIGRGQLRTLREFIQKKRELYQYYQTAFQGIPQIQMNPVLEEAAPNYWLTCITFEDSEMPDVVRELLENENIESRPIWKPMHLQPVYREMQCMTENGLMGNARAFPTNAEEIFKHGLCLPSDIKNTSEDMERIISIIKNAFS